MTDLVVWNYSFLQTQLGAFAYRDDLGTSIPMFINMGEAFLNRELPAVETDVALVGTPHDRTISLSSIAMVEPVALYITDESGDESEVLMRSAGDMPYTDDEGEPLCFAIVGTDIKFNCPLDEDYAFRLVYVERFALTDDAPTNWLLTHHPDVYLAACMVWGCAFLQAFSDPGMSVSSYSNILATQIPKVRRAIMKPRVGRLTVDPGLLTPGRYNVLTD